MAKVIGFEKPKKLKKYKATCPMCKAIIEYTNEDIHQIQHGEYIITCPNCNKWFSVG